MPATTPAPTIASAIPLNETWRKPLAGTALDWFDARAAV